VASLTTLCTLHTLAPLLSTQTGYSLHDYVAISAGAERLLFTPMIFKMTYIGFDLRPMCVSGSHGRVL